MNPPTAHVFSAIVLLVVGSIADAQNKEGVEGVDFGSLKVSQLTAVIGNNNAMGEHRPWYNGLFSLNSPHQGESPFVPKYAGLNLEHYFDAGKRRTDRQVFFETRAIPMSFKRIDARTVELRQDATPYWGVESQATIQLTEPYYVDYRFRCWPRKEGLEGDLLGVFWASYINGPLDKSIYFLSNGSTLDAPQWEQFYSQEHNLDSSLRHGSDSYRMPSVGERDALWRDESPLRYSEPFFYGRFKNMVLIYIFKSQSLARFTTSPSGGGLSSDQTAMNPAWDFQLLIPDYQVNKEYGVDVRLVYKPWVDRADVIEEARMYLDETL